jgi:hypothetical protein
MMTAPSEHTTLYPISELQAMKMRALQAEQEAVKANIMILQRRGIDTAGQIAALMTECTGMPMEDLAKCNVNVDTEAREITVSDGD